MTAIKSIRERRKKRVRYQIKKRAGNRLRLSVFRSHKHLYAQIIDDRQGYTLAAASTIDKELQNQNSEYSASDRIAHVGRLLAERAKARGISNVTFDRSFYLYHGKVKLLAEAARDNGLSF